MPPSESGSVLLVDDQPTVLTALRRALLSRGFRVATASSAREAHRAIAEEPPDVVLTDIGMPEVSGDQLLAEVRSRDPDLPVLLMTGAPSLGSAISALDLGAAAYLVKPVLPADLFAAIERAVRHGRLARARRVLDRAVATPPATPDHGAALDEAIASAWLAWQPIVRLSTGEPIAWEALVRSRHPVLADPGALFSVAERLGRLPDLGRAIRSRVVAPPHGALAFVNLHPLDLLDESLYDPTTSFGALAASVVLEITERAALDRVPDVEARVRRLKAMGFRIAIDDLGAGYAGLSAFARLDPDVAKLDMSLVRGLDADPVRQRLVSAFVPLCGDLGISLVAEGVETVAERDTLAALGCDLVQGYLFARPGPDFPHPRAVGG